MTSEAERRTFLQSELEGECKGNMMPPLEFEEAGIWQGQFSGQKLIYTEERYSEYTSCVPQEPVISATQPQGQEASSSAQGDVHTNVSANP